MKKTLLFLLATSLAAAAPVPLFDGKTLTGWETKHPERWRVENGALTSGDLKEKIPDNFFLFTEKSYADFEFRCQFRLTGDPATGLINSGIQFRSVHLDNGHASGYQADIGDVEWWGCIYDEHRRNKVIAQSDIAKIGPVVKRGDWNEYVIRCEGARSRLWINGVLTVDYVEPDNKIARDGKIAVQVHSGGAAKVEFKDITIEEFERKESPLSAAEQLGTFSVPEGYEVELVASEETGLPKPITVTFDDAGRMWSITATDYPVDANETPDQAMALWKNGGKDRVVIFDEPLKKGPHTPRTFADKLAMPMGVLPWKDGAIVGQGPEILFLDDTDADGKADKRTVLVKGFGVQDSHLMPHQFTMMPGGWIAMAQGAFNRSQVVAGEKPPVSFDYCKMGHFRPDGSDFETIAYGLNNIWGLVLNRQGEMFIQEANDMNYSVAPFQIGSSYPGIGNQKFTAYAPFAPPVANFNLGGTGLSGLALSEDNGGSFPDPWHDVMFAANPITRTINAVKVSEGGTKMERLPDFLSCSDDWFRPIAICFGPDGCLYITDWYNKIISHNEVPRKHPDRDKTRGRVWRVRHVSQTSREVPNIAKLPDAKLVEQLQSASTWAMRAAWRQIVFRNTKSLAPQLTALAKNSSESAGVRIHALWALRDLDQVDATLIAALSKDKNRNVRREAAAVIASPDHASDPDPQVRAQAIRTLARSSDIAALIAFAKPALNYDGEFERYLVRAALEKTPEKVAAFLDSADAANLPAENRLFASLALPPALSTPRFVRAWGDIDRAPNDEELLLLLKGSSDPQLAPIVAKLFAAPNKAPNLMRAALRLQDRVQAAQVQSVLTPALQTLATKGSSDDLVIEITSAFRLTALKDALIKVTQNAAAPVNSRAAAINALSRIDAGADATVMAIASDEKAAAPLRIAALTAAGSAGKLGIIAAASALPKADREDLFDGLAGSANGTDVIIAGIASGKFDAEELTLTTLDRMRTLRPDDAAMNALWTKIAARFPRVLKLSGKANQFSQTNISLEGAFTVETWVRLDPGINNADGILGLPGGADFNFYDSTFRVYGGPQHNDIAVASRPMTPGAWTHLAVTRSAAGDVQIYLNGELDAKGTKRLAIPFEGLNIGHTTAPKEGTSGEFMEFRIWKTERSADDIRANFNRKFEGSSNRPADLVHYFPQGGDPEKLSGGAQITAVAEAPKLLDDAEAAKEEERVAKFRAIAQKTGNAANGKVLFESICLSCHTAGGKGAAAAPPLDGSGHRDLDSLLRAVLTPDAAVEPGYRAYRVETHDGRLAEGFLVKHDANGATLRLMGGVDLQFPQAEIRQARYLNRSFMIAGLFDSLEEQQVTDIITYIGTLKED
jgi:putative membrane-bound dehydrogenase-like protein